MEVNPPTYTEEGCTTAQQDRLILSSLVCGQGVAKADDLEVTDAGNGSVTVSAGSAFIEGTQVVGQGMYHVTNDAPVTLALTPADPTDDRIDLVVARVYDSQYTGEESYWTLEVVEGIVSPSPAPPDLPPNSLVLAQVRVNAGSTALVITEARVIYRPCRGPYGVVQARDVYTSAANWTSGPDTYNQVRVYVHPERDRVDIAWAWRRTGAALGPGDFGNSTLAQLNTEWYPRDEIMLPARTNGGGWVTVAVTTGGQISAQWSGTVIPQATADGGYNLWVRGTYALAAPYYGPLPTEVIQMAPRFGDAE